MFPFVDIFGKEISLYTICALLGLFAALFCISRLARKRGLQPEDPMISLLVLIPFVLVGGLLLFGLTNLDYFCSLVAQWDRYGTAGQKAMAVLNGFSGFVFYGGLLGALAGMAVYCRVAKKPATLYFDMLAVVVPLFHAFGRVGCFLSGCCYGVEFPGGVVFTHATVDSANGVPRFPVQLFEAAFDLLIFLVLLRLFCRAGGDGVSQPGAQASQPGALMFVYFLLYGVLRFFDEFLRGDVYRGFLGPLSTSQWISLILIAVALGFFLRRWKKREASPYPDSRCGSF